MSHLSKKKVCLWHSGTWAKNEGQLCSDPAREAGLDGERLAQQGHQSSEAVRSRGLGVETAPRQSPSVERVEDVPVHSGWPARGRKPPQDCGVGEEVLGVQHPLHWPDSFVYRGSSQTLQDSCLLRELPEEPADLMCEGD